MQFKFKFLMVIDLPLYIKNDFRNTKMIKGLNIFPRLFMYVFKKYVYKIIIKKQRQIHVVHLKKITCLYLITKVKKKLVIFHYRAHGDQIKVM